MHFYKHTQFMHESMRIYARCPQRPRDGGWQGRGLEGPTPRRAAAKAAGLAAWQPGCLQALPGLAAHRARQPISLLSPPLLGSGPRLRLRKLKSRWFEDAEVKGRRTQHSSDLLRDSSNSFARFAAHYGAEVSFLRRTHGVISRSPELSALSDQTDKGGRKYGHAHGAQRWPRYHSKHAQCVAS